MTIYVTTFDHATQRATSNSEDSGFASIEQVVEVMGDGFSRRSDRCVVYPGVFFSDFVIRSEP